MTRNINRDHRSAFKVNQYKQAYSEGDKALSVIDILVFEDFLEETEENPLTYRTFNEIFSMGIKQDLFIS